MAKENKASCKVILHKIKTLKDGRHPIVLRVTFRGKRKYYSLGEPATIKEWEQILNASGRSKFKSIQKTVWETENQAEEVILEIEKRGDFTFDTFERTFFTERNNITVFQFFAQLIESFTKQGRIGNADIYKGTLNELKRFRKKKDLSFDDVTYTFLTRWETFLSPTNKINSIGIHMRTLRSAYNKAIKEGIASQENYPFKDYQIKKEAPVKRALRKEHIQRIYAYKAKPMSADWHAQKLFIFSYLCQGMAFSDMAYLKWENIIDDRIMHKRVKTIRTSKNPKVISIKITPNIAEILDAFRKADAQYDDFIFPILRKDMQPSTMKNTIKSKRKNLNKQLGKICKKVGIEGNITSYVARHSYGTVLKKNKIPTSVIRESMGHQTEQMTQTYLDSFENEIIDEANKGLLNNHKPWDKQKSQFISNVALNIDKTIQNKNWTRTKLAEEMQVSLSLVNEWLSGTYDFTLDVLFDICQVTDINFATLIKE